MQAEETAQLWPAAGGTSVRTFCRTLVELFVSAFFLLSQVVQTQGARLYGKLSRLKLDNLKSCCILHCSDNAA